ncbi:unnamed protein product [Laminaria digitata]
MRPYKTRNTRDRSIPRSCKDEFRTNPHSQLTFFNFINTTMPYAETTTPTEPQYHNTGGTTTPQYRRNHNKYRITGQITLSLPTN